MTDSASNNTQAGIWGSLWLLSWVMLIVLGIVGFSGIVEPGSPLAIGLAVFDMGILLPLNLYSLARICQAVKRSEQ